MIGSSNAIGEGLAEVLFCNSIEWLQSAVQTSRLGSMGRRKSRSKSLSQRFFVIEKNDD